MMIDTETLARIDEIKTLLNEQYADDMARIVSARKTQVQPDPDDCPIVPFLVLTTYPKEWTADQTRKAINAAWTVFGSVGVDPAFYNYLIPAAATDAYEKGFATSGPRRRRRHHWQTGMRSRAIRDRSRWNSGWIDECRMMPASAGQCLLYLSPNLYRSYHSPDVSPWKDY